MALGGMMRLVTLLARFALVALVARLPMFALRMTRTPGIRTARTAALLNALDGFTGATELPDSVPKRLNFAFVGVFLNFGLFERFDGLFHFKQDPFEVFVDAQNLFDGLANGRRGGHVR